MGVRLSAKKLDSGRFQVTFEARAYGPGFYGYLLTEAKTPVRDVLGKINRHLEAMKNSESYFQRNLYSLSLRNVHSGKILVFKKELKNDRHKN